MRRAVATLAVLAAAAACATPLAEPEQAYLKEVQDRGVAIQLEHPDQDLETGHAACAAIASAKPTERDLYAYLLEQHRPYTRVTVTAALRHLCPELGVNRY